MDDIVKKAMAEVAELNDQGIKVAGGKKYTQVVTRVEVFRKNFGFDVGINTDVKLFGSGFLVKATVFLKGGEQIGSGHAYATSIQQTKSIEKLETTAIGRALASCGLAGGEYCTQEEIDTFNERYQEPVPEPKPKPELTPEQKREKARKVVDKWIGRIRTMSLPHLIDFERDNAESIDRLKQDYPDMYEIFQRESDKRAAHLSQGIQASGGNYA